MFYIYCQAVVKFILCPVVSFLELQHTIRGFCFLYCFFVSETCLDDLKNNHFNKTRSICLCLGTYMFSCGAMEAIFTSLRSSCHTRIANEIKPRRNLGYRVKFPVESRLNYFISRL